MKKTVLKVLALVLVACMLFAFTSCTQEVLVRFVDAEGNDINFAEIFGGSGNVVTPSGDSGSSSDVTPSETPSTPAETPSTPAETPSQQTPAETPSQQTPAETPSQQAPAETPSQQAPAGDAMPTTKDQIAAFYANAVKRIKNNGEGGYVKKEWQAISNLKITGIGAADDKIAEIVGGYMTTADQADNQDSPKGSKEAKDRFPGWTVTDMGNIASASCTKNGAGNYAIVIKSIVEDTPKKEGSMMAKFTNSFLAWEDIETEIDNNVSVIKDYKGNVHLMYDVTIEAEITPDGKFVSMKHTTACDIKIAHAKLLVFNLDNKEAHLDNFCTYESFKY